MDVERHPLGDVGDERERIELDAGDFFTRPGDEPGELAVELGTDARTQVLCDARAECDAELVHPAGVSRARGSADDEAGVEVTAAAGLAAAIVAAAEQRRVAT